jgi:hypothetical protein
VPLDGVARLAGDVAQRSRRPSGQTKGRAGGGQGVSLVAFEEDEADERDRIARRSRTSNSIRPTSPVCSSLGAGACLRRRSLGGVAPGRTLGQPFHIRATSVPQRHGSARHELVQAGSIRAAQKGCGYKRPPHKGPLSRSFKGAAPVRIRLGAPKSPGQGLVRAAKHREEGGCYAPLPTPSSDSVSPSRHVRSYTPGTQRRWPIAALAPTRLR